MPQSIFWHQYSKTAAKNHSKNSTQKCAKLVEENRPGLLQVDILGGEDGVDERLVEPVEGSPGKKNNKSTTWMELISL